MADPIFRIARSADVDQLVELRLLMQCEVHQAEPATAPPEFFSAAREYFEASIASGSYISFVAEIEGSLVAANGLVLYRKPPALGGLSGRVGYVTNVYTRPEFRGRGYGVRLMRDLIAQAKILGAVKLHLGATEDGKRIYERVGFGPVRHAAMDLKLST